MPDYRNAGAVTNTPTRIETDCTLLKRIGDLVDVLLEPYLILRQEMLSDLVLMVRASNVLTQVNATGSSRGLWWHRAKIAHGRVATEAAWLNRERWKNSRKEQTTILTETGLLIGKACVAQAV
jgi:hypothetical protein